MRLSENLEKGQVAAQVVFTGSLVATAVLASFHIFGSNVLSRTWARAIVLVALVGAVFLGLNRDFYMPFLGPTVVPTSVLRVGVPSDASVAISIDVPSNVTHVVYWAASPSTMPANSPMEAYRGFRNAGIVETSGGRATMRLACPGTYKVGWGRLLPRHVHYRYIFNNGIMSSVKTASVKCPST
jgi:hypothetical protein